MTQILPRKTLHMEWSFPHLQANRPEAIVIKFKNPTENGMGANGMVPDGANIPDACPTRRRFLRILMVEDSREDFDLICFHLNKCGYAIRAERVFCEETMRAALNREEWDIVFTDHGLPGFTGKAAIALLREMNLNLPVLCVTGSIDPTVIRQILAAGASACVSKDDLSLLCATIERVLSAGKNNPAEIHEGKKTGGKQPS